MSDDQRPRPNPQPGDAGPSPEEVQPTPRNGAPRHPNEFFTVRHEVIEYRSFAGAMAEIGRIHRRGVHAAVAEFLLLLGQSGSGKTTALKTYASRHPRRRVDGRMVIPVLLVGTPEAPTVRSLTEAVLFALGDPFAFRKESAARNAERIKQLMQSCGVELIAFDDFHHFVDCSSSKERQKVTDHLKRFINEVGVPVVLAGLPKAIEVTHSNIQLRRRFSAQYYIQPFGASTKEEQLDLRGLLKAFGKSLPTGSVDISSFDMAKRFYYATSGLIDYFVKLLDDAVSRGGSGPGGAITCEDLAAAFTRAIWEDAPKKLNPFEPNSHLRLLREKGEPFEDWDDIGRYRRWTKKP